MSTSIVQIIAAYKSGQPLEDIIPQGADLRWWRSNIDRLVANQAKPQKRAGPKRRRISASRRQHTAGSVLMRDVGRAMAEQVSRVNSQLATQSCLICREPAEVDGYCATCYNNMETPDPTEIEDWGCRVSLAGASC